MSSNVIAFNEFQPREVCRVAPIEAKWVRQAEQDSRKATAGLRAAAPAVHAEIAAGDHAIQEELHRYAAVHREHIELGLRDFHPMVKPGAYWALLFGAAALEAPVNKSALDFLAMASLETWLVAGFLSVLNVLAASIVGKRLRQVTARPRRDWFVLGAVALVTIGTMFAMAGLRADHIAFSAASESLPTSAYTPAALVLLQALFFVVGSALSFAMVPAEPRLQRVLADKAKLRHSLDQLLRQRTALAARHDKLWLDAERAIAERRAECLALVGEYRDNNFAARGSTALPSWMRRPLDPAVFTPIELGPRVLTSMPPLQQLLQQAEARAAAEPAGTAAEG
jgi:hypothetical protein